MKPFVMYALHISTLVYIFAIALVSRVSVCLIGSEIGGGIQSPDGIFCDRIY